MALNLFSAHIGYLYTELPLLERIAAAAGSGFTAVEHPQPFAIPATEMRAELARHGLVLSQVAAGMEDSSKGEKGLAALPGREPDFREGFNRALDYAIAVDCPFVHPMAGAPTNAEVSAVAETYHRNLGYAVERTAGTSVKILVEAISEAAVPGYFMSTLDHASRIQDIFGPGNLSLLLDAFHARANGVALENWIPANAHRIGHVHIADHPGRHEPGTGSIDFEELLGTLAEQAYGGAIGFEYTPSTTTVDSAAFLPRWKQLMAVKLEQKRQDRRPA
ncbi:MULTISPECIES: hydroxypyruvate isomerase family protein [Sinorhizobium]|uniref:Hydroxypyruvate isomerase n=2 Tax=Sinorhizobium TaxID=28105 RepID=A0A2S3YNN2_9HYPH|nr:MULTISPECIES: TIM barrel protein [Sinorhizobium]AUX76259.1 hydroxypyruvate isomerase protein [Sinorhizobium fredii]PDT42617.1 hydroxypyruvate isomerase [Sinorhizobium sp. FG01]POH32544.1 hydroxypyruvate isomerase [Sinorhizobium americanum]